MPIDFPTSPTNGQQYTFNGKTWQWDTVSWLSVTASTIPLIREDIAGTKNGSNTAFTITATGSAVAVYKNGILLKEGVGYTISGTNITALSGYIPESTHEYEAVIYV